MKTVQFAGGPSLYSSSLSPSLVATACALTALQISRGVLSVGNSRDQQVQTEYTVIAKKAKKAPLSLEATAADILTRPLNLKFHKDPLGNIKSLAIRFK
jgi:hypothetical protein